MAGEKCAGACTTRCAMRSILLLLTLALTLHVGAAAGLPRVAVVPDSAEPSVAAFADFLAASLATASDNYALVERAEVTRLAAEAEIQKLAAVQRPAALAKLAQADGLIIVGADKGDPKLPKLTLRLTSTNNGLVLRSLILGSKEAEFPQAAELAAGVLRFPCERLTHGDAKPPIIISLLGIRPAFEIDRALETTLNLAIAQQLSAQSGIAVSERWKMNDLVFERSLTDEKPQAFATGTILLDGSYTRQGDELEVTLRLRKAAPDQGRNLQLKGPATKPTDLAQQIAKLVAVESGQNPDALPAWDAARESEQYAKLGWWLRERAQGEEAVRAYETAAALGVPNRSLYRDRVWAYQSILNPENIEFINDSPPWFNTWLRLPKHEFRNKLMIAIRMTQVTIEALDRNWDSLPEKGFDRDRRKLTLTQTFDIDMKVLQGICLRKEQLELATEARELRALARDLVARSERSVTGFAGDLVQRIYMHDTPADAAVDLRQLLMPKLLTDDDKSRGRWLRSNFWKTYQTANLWRFVDWSSTDNRQGDLAWKSFVSELINSNNLLCQADGLAFAFQTAHDDQEQGKLLEEYCNLLDRNWDQVLTPDGQRSFYSFVYYYYGNKKQYSGFDLRMTQLATRIFASGEWTQPATISLVNWLTMNWARMAQQGKPAVPEAAAGALLEATENYMIRAKADPRWRNQYQLHNSGQSERDLKKIPERIILAYPDLKSRRIIKQPMAAGSIDIREWHANLPGEADGSILMSCFYHLSHQDSMFVAAQDRGIIDLNLKTMAARRIMDFPLKGCPMIRGITSNNDSMMVNMNNRLFMTSLSSAGEPWTEVEFPDFRGDKDLNWCINGLGHGFLVGSSMGFFDASPPRMLLGTASGRKLTWAVSSYRRPAVSPLDEEQPRSTRMAYQNEAGKTMVILEKKHGRCTLTELETGREICDLIPNGRAESRGEMPLYWHHYNEITQFLGVFDPDREQPRLILKATQAHLDGHPEFWNHVKPLYDNQRPELLGEPLGFACAGGRIWMLKRQLNILGVSDKNDPQAFRLVRLDKNGGEPVVIPLRYTLPESVRKLGTNRMPTGEGTLDRPMIDRRSLTANSKGLFFSPEMEGDLTPVLFYITWDDVNAWLAKNAPESATPASP